jgi:hypothetical protein
MKRGRPSRNYLKNPTNILDIIHMLVDIKVAPPRLFNEMEPHEKFIFDNHGTKKQSMVILLTVRPFLMNCFIVSPSEVLPGLANFSLCSSVMAERPLKYGPISALTSSGIFESLLVFLFIITQTLQAKIEKVCK